MADQQMVRIILHSGAIDRDAPKRERAMRQAFRTDGKLRPDALTAALPWMRLDALVPGAPALGPLPVVAWRFPQPCTIHRLDALCTTVPTGTFGVWLTVNGADAENVAISAGQSSGTSGAAIAVPAGGIVRWRVSSIGGAADLTLTIHYTITQGGA